jgi:hypothetical protein
MRSLEELINRDEPGIRLVREWIAKARNPVELLPSDKADGERTLLALQVTSRSPMGAIAYETGGLLVDRGWLRILGAGCPRLSRGLADWNRLGEDPSEPRIEGALLVGDDVVGGFFAVNGGRFEGTRGNVFYLAPDTLAWEDLNYSYSDWVHWVCTGDLEKFYENVRWPGWEKEVSALDGTHGISIYPFLWAEGPPVQERNRGAVPLEELWNLHALDLPKQLQKEHR